MLRKLPRALPPSSSTTASLRSFFSLVRPSLSLVAPPASPVFGSACPGPLFHDNLPKPSESLLNPYPQSLVKPTKLFNARFEPKKVDKEDQEELDQLVFPKKGYHF